MNYRYNDDKRYNSILVNKSKSCIGSNEERPIKWFELIDQLKSDSTFEKVLYLLNNKANDNWLKNIENTMIKDKFYSESKIKLIIKFLSDRSGYLWKN